MIRKLLLDAAAAGLALMVFALFHHVLPRAQQSLNVQTIRPVQAEETAVPETEEVRTAEAKAEDRTAAAEPETDETASATAAEKTEGYRPTVRTTASSGRSDSGGRKSGSRQNSRKSGKSSGMNSKGGSALTENDEAAEASAEPADETPLAETGGEIREPVYGLRDCDRKQLYQPGYLDYGE